MKSFICLFLLQVILFFPLNGWAFLNKEDKGTCSAEFLKIGVGARAVGMGEAYSAVANEASAIYWNPAGLSRIKRRSATFMHAALFGEISYEFLGYSQEIKDAGAFGIAIQYLSAGTIHETDSSGFEIGSSFSPRDLAVTLAYSRLIQEFGIGISGKYIRSEIIKTASTFAADVGVLSPRLLQERLRLSLVVQNVGGRLKFDRESDPLPLNIKVGSCLSIKENWIGAADLNFPKDNQPYIAIGTEYRIPYETDWRLAGRLGFNSKTIGDVSGFTGFSFGLGIKFKQIGLDYALLPFGPIGLTHRISITARF